MCFISLWHLFVQNFLISFFLYLCFFLFYFLCVVFSKGVFYFSNVATSWMFVPYVQLHMMHSVCNCNGHNTRSTRGLQPHVFNSDCNLLMVYQGKGTIACLWIGTQLQASPLTAVACLQCDCNSVMFYRREGTLACLPSGTQLQVSHSTATACFQYDCDSLVFCKTRGQLHVCH